MLKYISQESVVMFLAQERAFTGVFSEGWKIINGSKTIRNPEAAEMLL